MAQLIHPELSYDIRGVLLDVHNTLGPMLREEYYENAIAIGLEKRQIRIQTQKAFEVYYEGERVGLYYTDLWVEDGKVLLELKVAPAITAVHKAQALSYLKVSNADLAIVANFGGRSLEDERLPNFLRNNQTEFTWKPHPNNDELLHPDLSDAIYRVCHKVHFALGAGFLHQVYRRATMIELRRSGLGYEYIKQLPIEYETHLLGFQDARLILVEDKILLATFALQQANDAIVEQFRAHLRRLQVKLGLLTNFYGTKVNITPVRTA